MIKSTVLEYKCGCKRIELYTKGATAREVKATQAFAKQKPCPKCEDKK